MRIRRRHLRRTLVLVGCIVGQPVFPAWLLGVALLMLGGALHLWCKGHLEQNRRVTTSGPYRYSRNPFYLANALIDLGLVLVIGRVWVALIYLPVWIYAYHQTILREEAHLRALFGAEFERYVERVPRLLPVRKPLAREPGSSRFDWSNPSLANGREYARLLGIALSAGAIAVAHGVREVQLGFFSPEADPMLLLVALLGVAWIVKLGLAEAMRQPELALVPTWAQPSIRSLWIAFVFAPSCWLAAGSGLDAIALGWLVAAAVALMIARRGGSPGVTGWLLALLTLAVGGLGAVSEEGWLASWPMLWLSLYALDELARTRLSKAAATTRSLWSFFVPIAGAASGFVVLAGWARLGLG